MEYTTTYNPINPMDDRVREELAKLATEPCREEKMEKQANYKELTGRTWNNLIDTLQLLRLICLNLEGDANTSKNDSDPKCFRDVLVMTNEKSYEILTVVNQIAEVIGVG